MRSTVIASDLDRTTTAHHWSNDAGPAQPIRARLATALDARDRARDELHDAILNGLVS